MDVKQIILGVIVVIILYLVWTYIFNDPNSSALYSGGSASSAVLIPASKLVGNPASVDFAFSMWIYISSWAGRYGKEKVVLRRKNGSGNAYSPKVILGASTNKLTIGIGSWQGDSASSGDVSPYSDTWDVQNIPIQRWVNIIISIRYKINLVPIFRP